MRNQKVIVLVRGGLGNQLFQFSAGLMSINRSVGRLFMKNLSPSHLDILAFNLQDFELDLIQGRKYFPDYVIERFLRKFQLIIVKFRLERSLEKFGLYMIDIPGKLSWFVKLTGRQYLLGYFQDIQYAERFKILTNSTTLKIQNPTDWFTQNEIRIQEVRPVAIHIRRGDYLNFSDTLGTLDFAYYKNAVENLKSESNAYYWIFSDSIEEAERFKRFSGVEVSRIEIMDPPAGSSPVESLLLMSYASAIIISNSTFSWWAGFLSENSTPVVAPSKWFRGLPNPINLIPNHWRIEESVWLEH